MRKRANSTTSGVLKLRGLHNETTRINRIVQAEFGRIEPADWR
jgi:hypothetical protein